jgi:hypothetical protein
MAGFPQVDSNQEDVSILAPRPDIGIGGLPPRIASLLTRRFPSFWSENGGWTETEPFAANRDRIFHNRLNWMLRRPSRTPNVLV